MLRVFGCLLVGTLLGGCALSEEDKDFYYGGWVKPNRNRNYDEHGQALRNPPGTGYRPDPLDQ